MANDQFRMREIAHDIKGLTTRAGLAAELLSQHADENVRRQADRIARAIDQVTLICRREFEQPADPDVTRAHDCYDARRMIDKVITLAQGKHANALALTYHVHVDPQMHFTTDALVLFRVLFNLLTKATRVAVSNDASDIVVNVTRDQGFITFAITIAGPELADGTLALLYSTSRNDNRDQHHSGFGLVTAINLVRDLGGDLVLDETDPCGAAFQVRIPCTAHLRTECEPSQKHVAKGHFAPLKAAE